jgi:hypothetical protein
MVSYTCKPNCHPRFDVVQRAVGAAVSTVARLAVAARVAVSGVAQVNTVLFAAAMGAFNVTGFSVVAPLARRGWTQLDD